MNFKAKYLSLIIFAVLSFDLKAEDNRTAENLNEFTASEYFSPFRSGEDISSWPKKLTLTRMMTTPFADITNQILATEWETVFHCSGQNIPVEKYRPLIPNVEGFDFLILDQYVIVDGRMEVIRTFYPQQSGARVIVSPSFLVKIIDLGFGKLIIDRGLDAIEYQMYRIQETDELVFQQDGSFESSEICPEDTELKLLLVPYAKAPISFESIDL